MFVDLLLVDWLQLLQHDPVTVKVNVFASDRLTLVF